MHIVVPVSIIAVVGVALLAAAAYWIDRDADRRDHRHE